MQQVERRISCPYCGESIEVLLDPSVDLQEYIEDCQVCCRPITFLVTAEPDGNVCVSVTSEHE
ncbi:MAG: CPXCG motif-containing cysteine-rich protein [Proteobacteria bacterium]|nr:CPXCG motif-containing cysteine-rich protein [Pseudomonadota bacterium]MDA1298595.1 CPXCG motif-containing cysteine-rich protein [Pseudomonadota bacterium]